MSDCCGHAGLNVHFRHHPFTNERVWRLVPEPSKNSASFGEKKERERERLSSFKTKTMNLITLMLTAQWNIPWGGRPRADWPGARETIGREAQQETARDRERSDTGEHDRAGDKE